METKHAILIGAGLIAVAVWDQSGKARDAKLCDRLISKLPVELLVTLSTPESGSYAKAASVAKAVGEQTGITLERCRQL